jgi:two-component system sensor histidine kinase YesM
MRQSLYGALVACVVLALVISLVSALLFSRRIERLVFRMQALERGEFKTWPQPRSRDEIGYLEESFNRMTSRLEKHIQTAYVYQLKSKTAELKALQAQINPHFLFNTLESIRINALMNKDEQTARMIHLLGNLFRWNIKTRGMFVELRQEIEYADAFIELELMRYADAFEVKIEVPQKLLQLGVPKFILQPLVENAIKHGQMGVIEGGLITIEARVEEEARLVIAVADNGRGMDEEALRRIEARLDDPGMETEDSYSIGLSNVHQRLRILFGEPYGMSIQSEPGVRTVVTIAMPAMRKEEMETYVQSNHRG